jgi:hypothetical protein
MAKQGEHITVLFTRISSEDVIDAETRRERWMRLDYRMRALVVNIGKLFTPEELNKQFLSLMKFWILDKG